LGSLERIEKLQELLRKAIQELELLKKEIGNTEVTAFDEDSMGIRRQLEDLANHFGENKEKSDK
jgi:hypothetical protein